MNLPTIQIPYYFTDQRHSGYADAVMAGKVSSANFVFVSDVEDIAPILPEEPDLRLGSPEHFLGAFMAALAKPENLKALPHIIAFWQDRRLAPLSLLAEAYLGVGLQKYARDAQVPQQRTLYRQAVAKLKREIAKNASPVTPQALEFLCLWPDIAAQKLGLLVEGADYSPVLAKLGFTGTARNIAAFLLKNGFARNLRAITGYLLPLLETLQETAGKTSPGTAHNTLPPEKLTLGTAAEIALANGVSELVRRRENLDSSDYRDLSRCLHRIRPGVALNIFLKLIGADLVTETRHVMEMRTNREIVVHSPDTVFSDIRRLAEKRQDPQMNLKIAAALYDIALPRENYELPQLAAVLLAQPQKRPEDWNALLGFARHVLQDCNASSQQLYRCLCAVALNSGEFADMVEVAEFKHWAVEKAGLWRCGWDPVQNVFRSRGSFRETDSTAFVVFYADSPHSLDWKKSLPALLRDTDLKPQVRREAVEIIAARHCGEKPDFLLKEDLEKLAEWAPALPDAWLETLLWPAPFSPAALTGAVFTRCSGRRRFHPLLWPAPFLPAAPLSRQPSHPAVSAAPARFFFLPLAGQDFFYPPCKKTLAFSN